MNENKQLPSVVVPWVIMVHCLLYGVSPVDIIPDIPIVGQIDDFIIMASGTLNLCVKCSGKVVTRMLQQERFQYIFRKKMEVNFLSEFVTMNDTFTQQITNGLYVNQNNNLKIL